MDFASISFKKRSSPSIVSGVCPSSCCRLGCLHSTSESGFVVQPCFCFWLLPEEHPEKYLVMAEVVEFLLPVWETWSGCSLWLLPGPVLAVDIGAVTHWIRALCMILYFSNKTKTKTFLDQRSSLVVSSLHN